MIAMFGFNKFDKWADMPEVPFPKEPEENDTNAIHLIGCPSGIIGIAAVFILISIIYTCITLLR